MSYIHCILLYTSNISGNMIEDTMDFFRIMAYDGRIIGDIIRITGDVNGILCNFQLLWGEINFNTVTLFPQIIYYYF